VLLASDDDDDDDVIRKIVIIKIRCFFKLSIIFVINNALFGRAFEFELKNNIFCV
jgi:hypothetical protein